VNDRIFDDTPARIPYMHRICTIYIHGSGQPYKRMHAHSMQANQLTYLDMHKHMHTGYALSASEGAYHCLSAQHASTRALLDELAGNALHTPVTALQAAPLSSSNPPPTSEAEQPCGSNATTPAIAERSVLSGASARDKLGKLRGV